MCDAAHWSLGRLFGDGAKQASPHRPLNLGRVGHPHTKVFEGSSRIRGPIER